MGEQLQISIGKAGNDIGLQYLRALIEDHGLYSKDQMANDGSKKNIQVSFKEIKDNQHVFRGIFDYSDQFQSHLQDKQEGQFIDLNSILPEMNESYQGTYHSNLNNFVSQQKMYFVDKLRMNIEECDRLTGFNFSHSTFNNSAGAASKAQLIAKDEYPSVLLSSFSIFPDLQCVSAIDIYNVIFSISNLVENCDVVMMYDYQALAKAIQGLKMPSLINNYHNIVSETMLQFTCPQRFKGFQNGSLRKLATNLIPYPRIHFLTCSFAPLRNRENLTNQIENLSLPQNTYFTLQDNNENQYLCQALITRCAENDLIYQEASKNFQNKLDWIDDTFHQVNCSKEHFELGKTLMHVGNLRHLGYNFKAYQELFTVHFRRKTFLHHYTQLGIDEMEFTEAESNVNDLISEYQGPYSCGAEAEDYYDEEEEYEYY